MRTVATPLCRCFGDVPEAERRKVREQLERYCGQDTEGMVWIVDALRRLVA
jgi:hypothetical protein